MNSIASCVTAPTFGSKKVRGGICFTSPSI